MKCLLIDNSGGVVLDAYKQLSSVLSHRTTSYIDVRVALCSATSILKVLSGTVTSTINLARLLSSHVLPSAGTALLRPLYVACPRCRARQRDAERGRTMRWKRSTGSKQSGGGDAGKCDEGEADEDKDNLPPDAVLVDR